MTPTIPTNVRELLDNTTTGVAVAMTVSPWWLTGLKSASEISAILAPTLGVIWLAVQIWAKIKTTLEDKPDE